MEKSGDRVIYLRSNSELDMKIKLWDCNDACFTIADITVGYALHLRQFLGLDSQYTPQVKDYLARFWLFQPLRKPQP
jgi:hypothetical protein